MSQRPDTRRRLHATLLLALGCVAGLCGPAQPQEVSRSGVGGRSRDPGQAEVLIAWRAIPATATARAAQRLAAQGFRRLRLPVAPEGPETWAVPPGLTAAQAAAALRRDPAVRLAEPNITRRLALAPNDPFFAQGYSWPLLNLGGTLANGAAALADADIDATEAWDVTTGSRAVVVAVIDTGIHLDHPDLAANIWTNPGEIAGNGLDDDGNGFADDCHGWDFADDDADPASLQSHGTFVAGVAGMVGNNAEGATGVCWEVSLMALRVFGEGRLDDIIAAIDYAAAMGADVINASFGGPEFSALEREAIGRAAAAGTVCIAAAGNNAIDLDAHPFYPAALELPNVLSVGATTPLDTQASFSNWGRNALDLFAPGIPIFSTGQGSNPGGDPNGYVFWAGTSFAAPHASGVAALLRAAAPALPASALINRLRVGADPLATLADTARTGGRLNAAASLASGDASAPAAVTDLHLLDVGTHGARLLFTAPGDDGLFGTPALWDVRVSTAPLSEEGWDAAPRAWDIPIPVAGGQSAVLPLSRVALDTLRPATTYHAGVRAVDEAGNRGPLSNPCAFTTRGETVLFFDDFETDSGAWEADPPWQRTDRAPAASGQFCYHDSVSPESYAPGADISLTLTTPVDLRGASRAVQMSFLTQHDLFIGLFALRDGGAVEVSTDGIAWQRAAVLHSWAFPYRRVIVPLGRWAGEPAVRVRFRLFSDEGSSVGDGWWIDDVAITDPAAPVRSTPDIIVESRGVGLTPPLLDTYVDTAPPEDPWVTTSTKSTLAVLDARDSRVHPLGVIAGVQAVFRPWLPVSGEYEVAVTWSTLANASDVTARVDHAAGTSAQRLTQDGRLNADRWISLGTFPFAMGNSGALILDAAGVTGRPDTTRPSALVADAARWRLVAAAPATAEVAGQVLF